MTTTVTLYQTGPLTANGVTALPFTFQAINASSIEVLRAGVLVSPAAYSVTLNENGTGTITPLATWGSDEVYIRSAPDYQQPADFPRFTPLYPDAIVPELDRLMRTIIGLKRRVDSVGDANTDLLREDLAALSGSSLVNFQPSGGTARSTQDKLRDMVSIKDFGAIGDGVANDTAALISAFATGRHVHLPAGTYLMTPSVFTGLLSLKISGAGRDVTKIKLSSTGTMMTFSNCQWLQISDLSIEATGTAQSLANAIGMQIDTGSGNSIIERVNFYGFSLDGIRYVGTLAVTLSGHTLRDVNFLGCGRNQLYGYYCNDFTFDNTQSGRFAGITKADFGILMENCGEGSFLNTKVWDNKRGMKLLNCTGIRYTGVRGELSDFENLWIEGGYNHNFCSSSRFYSPSQGGNGVSDNIYLKNALNVSLPCEATTWDATYGRYALNIDTGCDRIKLDGFRPGGYDVTKAPIRVASPTPRIRANSEALGASAVAAGATVYIGPNGAAAGEGIPFHIDNPMQIFSIIAAPSVAPGVGQTFTYTLRKNGVDTTFVLTLSGDAAFIGKLKATTPLPTLVFDEDDFWSIKLVASAGAAVADHRLAVSKVEI